MTLKKMESLEELLNLDEKDVVTVAGSHGKTTFCLNLCEELQKREKTVFLTTTTKIFPVNKKYGFIALTHTHNFKTENDIENSYGHKESGVYVLGIYDREIGKISSLPLEILEKLSEKCDYMIIEGDGSKRKPLKGWKKNEPVYIGNTTISVGIIPINIIGKKVNEINIHRIEEFLEISEGKENELLTLEHLYNVIIHKNGLFQYAVGKRNLLMNCAETEKDRKNALELSEMIKKNKDFQDVEISAASLQNKEYYKVEGDYSEKNSIAKISAVIMASGKSARMGENKLLLEYGGLTFIENIVKKVIHTGFYEIAVVVSNREVKEKCQEFIKKFYEENNSELDAGKIYIVQNESSEKGQSESVKLGLKVLEKCDGYMFFSGDQPNLTQKTIRKVMKNFEKGMIIIPEYNGKQGLPTIFSENFRDELLNLEGDTGGKPVLIKNSDKIKKIKIEDISEGMDIDTKEEYEILKRGGQNVYGRNNNEQ